MRRFPSSRFGYSGIRPFFIIFLFVTIAFPLERVMPDSVQPVATGGWAIRAGGGWRTYTGVFAGDWRPGPFTGITLDLPTPSPGLFFRVTGDGGMVLGRVPSVPQKLLALRESLSGVAAFGRFGHVTLNAYFGISSATFFFSPSFELSTKPFTTSESEFGTAIGMEALWRHNRFEIAFPLSFDCIFSLPHPLFVLSAGLQAGGRF